MAEVMRDKTLFSWKPGNKQKEEDVPPKVTRQQSDILSEDIKVSAPWAGEDQAFNTLAFGEHDLNCGVCYGHYES